MKNDTLKYGSLLFAFLCNLACSSTNVSPTTEETSDNDTIVETVNTTKLEGTPFEGLETGDDLYWQLFIESPYDSHTVDSWPIPVFLAYFTESEEEEVVEGINIANEAIGYEAFIVTDTWTTDVRSIIKVNEIADPTINNNEPRSAVGKTSSIYYCFENTILAECVVTDWQIEIHVDGVSRWIVAHELGHAFGISSHAMIDYENDAFVALEENSLMDSIISAESASALTDYTTMMQRQGEILLDHLNDASGTRFLIQ